MVYEAISHRVPYPESDIRFVVKLRRLQFTNESRVVTVDEVMKHLKITTEQAQRIMKVSADIAAGMVEFDHENHIATDNREPWPDAQWVIDALHDILGADFNDFWMWTGRVMSLEELGRSHGITKQAMAKRVAKWRRLVEASPHSERMIAWLQAQ